MQSVTVWAVRTGPRGDTYMLMQEGWDWAHGSLWMGCIPAEGPPYRVQVRNQFRSQPSFLMSCRDQFLMRE